MTFPPADRSFAARCISVAPRRLRSGSALAALLVASAVPVLNPSPASAANELWVSVAIRDASTDEPLWTVRRGQAVEVEVSVANTTSAQAANVTLGQPSIGGLVGTVSRTPSGPYTIDPGATQTIVYSGLSGSMQASTPHPAFAVAASGQVPDDTLGFDAGTEPDAVSGSGFGGADLADLTATVQYVQFGNVVTRLVRGEPVTLRMTVVNSMPAAVQLAANSTTFPSTTGLTGSPAHSSSSIAAPALAGWRSTSVVDVTGFTVTGDVAATTAAVGATITGSVPDNTLQPNDANTIADLVGTNSPTATAPVREKAVITQAPDLVSHDMSPTFEFTGPPGASGFRCQVDEGALIDCGTPLTVNLEDEGPHTFKVGVKESDGSVLYYASHSWTVVVDPPSAPTIGAATSGKPGAPVNATVTWQAPADDGGLPVSEYRVQAQKLKASGGVARRFTVVRGPRASRYTMALPTGRYTFRVAAANDEGLGPWSATSNKVRAR